MTSERPDILIPLRPNLGVYTDWYHSQSYRDPVVISADSHFTYDICHSEARSWSIPSEDPYEEVARQLLEQAPTPPLPPSFLSPRIRPPHTRAAMRQMRDCSTIHLSSTTPIKDPTIVGESSATAAARQPGPIMARRVDCSSVDTVDVRSRESSEFYSRHHDAHAQKDRATARVEIEDLARSEAYNWALEARITVLETQARRHEWQRQDADDRSTRHIMRIQDLKAGASDDTLEDTGSSA
ncbi:hypothetical protein Tco_0025365 [Tanacetum coccineum]